MSRPGVLLRRSRDILEAEGLTALSRRCLAFVGARLFRYEDFYLYEHTMRERDEADFVPRIDGLTFKIVRTSEEADELAEATAFDLRSRLVGGQERLDRGAIAFCFLVNGEFAHIGWVALSEEAKEALDARPYRVDFSNGQACTGGTFTIPEFRGRGLMTYSYFKRLESLREMGFCTSRNVVSVGNVASQKAQARLGPRVVARARHMRFLRWESWRETPIG